MAIEIQVTPAVRKFGASFSDPDFLPATVSIGEVFELTTRQEADTLIKAIRKAVKLMEKTNANFKRDIEQAAHVMQRRSHNGTL